MKRLRNCPGSLRLAATVPNPDSAYALEGTEAHALAAKFLEARDNGWQEPDTFGMPPDMIEHVNFYVDHITSLKTPGTYQAIETRFSLEHIYPGSFGTADAVTYVPKERLMIVTDLKYGAGVFVDVVRNDQLMYYAVGAHHALNLPVEKIRCEIVQPRIGTAAPVREWDTDIFDLIEFQDEIKQICEATEDPNAPLAVGEWCRFCPAAAADICLLLKEERKALARRVFKDQSIQEVNLDELAENLRWVPVFEAQFAMMHEYAYTLAMKGHKIPGMKLVPKRASRDWRDKQAAAEAIFEKTGAIIERTEKVLLSPSQVEKLPAENFTVKKKDVKELIAGDGTEENPGLVEWKSSGYALVPEYDAREERKQVEAKSVFVSAEENDALT